jgi:hypothetical protein
LGFVVAGVLLFVAPQNGYMGLGFEIALFIFSPLPFYRGKRMRALAAAFVGIMLGL